MHIYIHTGHSGLNYDDLSGEMEKIKGIDHKDIELKRAIGQKTFDIEVQIYRYMCIYRDLIAYTFIYRCTFIHHKNIELKKAIG